MVHSLRKYLSNRGSALFMVLSTMTALMITCMAMYFAVVSSRTQQIAVFNQEQSYQTARSISDILLDGLKSGVLAGGESNLLDKMMDLDEGDTISTDGNGFKSLNPSGTKEDEDDPLDAGYDIKITRLKDEMVDGETNQTFDVAITTSVNGVREVVHNVLHIRPAQNVPQPISDGQVFAATGYVDQDVYIDGGEFLTDMFIDSEITVWNAYEQQKRDLKGNISVGGSFELRADVNGYTEPCEWYIRNKLEAPKYAGVNFVNTGRSKVYVGGDMDMGDNWGYIKNADIYVNGDFYFGNQNFENCRIFVHGNLYVRGSSRDVGKFYCDGEVVGIKGGSPSGSIKGKWSGNTHLPDDVEKFEDAIRTLDKKTASTVYYKWEINDSHKNIRTKDEKGRWVDTGKKDPTYVKELDEKTDNAIFKTLRWDTSDGNLVLTERLTYGGKLEGKDKNGNTRTFSDVKGCIIEDTTWNFVNNENKYRLALIIDTGDDPDNVFTIRVKANRDVDGDGVKESFCWHPDPNVLSSTGFDSALIIITKGKGSVVVDVPPGVTYQDTTRLTTIHYNWYILAGGSTYKLGKNEVFNLLEQGVQSDISRFVHKHCNGTTCGCKFKTEDSTEVCTLCKGTKKAKTCEIHEHTFLYCPNCNLEPDCVNRVGRKEITDYLNANPAVRARMDTIDGKWYYPTTNFFLVSVDESADIRHSITKEGNLVGENTFFGFIYAPYMTFKGYGSNQGRGKEVRFFGGATVSDYIFQDSMSFVTCWPERTPTELMSESSRQETLSGSAKPWKISLGSY